MTCKKSAKWFRLVFPSCTIATVLYAYVTRCRPYRHSEGSESLLPSRGRVSTPTSKAQSFDRTQTNPLEVASTQ
jgi:hypothetical protein